MSWIPRCIALAILAASGTVAAEFPGTGDPSLRAGASIYQQRCLLCHGSKGMGEGLLPVRIAGYPNTNLVSASRAVTLEEIERAVQWGGFREAHRSDYSPPWIYELSEQDVQQVVTFVRLLREDNEAALRLLAQVPLPAEMSGATIFTTRCAICHGSTGHGDGRLSAVVKAPPPANLTVSRLSREEMIEIITGGGQSVSRSPQMPPWGLELNSRYIQLVADYLLQLRAGHDAAD
jgi:cytochrome c oxidase cbb3-type subunit III